MSNSNTGGMGPTRVTAGLLAAALVTALYLLVGDVDLGMGDEGFLWYGVRRVSAGEVPLRDFQSYEPGRYFWCAAGAALLGDGILALRVSILAFGGLGLFFGLLAARRAVRHPLELIPVGLVLAAWIFPRHKTFEPSLAMAAVYAGVRLIESTSRRRFFFAGLFVGLLGFFGRNHTLYTALGFLGLLLWQHWKLERAGDDPPLVRKLLSWVLGVVAGFTPLFVMFAVVPGFAAGFLDSVLFFAEHGSNVPRPMPLPWSYDYSTLSAYQRAAAFSIGTSFLLLPTVCLAGIVTAIFSRGIPSPARVLFYAASFVGLFYAHHASVRSDELHLAQCIHPMLLAFVALPACFRRTSHPAATNAVRLLLLVVTLYAVTAGNPLFFRYQPGNELTPLLEQRVGEDTLRLPPRKANDVRKIREVAGRLFAPEDEVFIAPNRPIFYPILDKRSPTWGIYFLWKGDGETQAEIIGALDRRAVRWVLIVDIPVDRRVDLLFQNSHPTVWKYLMTRYLPVEDRGLPGSHRLFRRR